MSRPPPGRETAREDDDDEETTLQASLPIGGMIPTEPADDELALGDAEDYDDEDGEYTGSIALGDYADDGERVFGLSFNAAGGNHEPTGEWDLGGMRELVVNETQGQFDADGSVRNDVLVMEDFDDAEDEVLMAVWADSGDGRVRVGTVVRRRVSSVPRAYLPYGFIAAGLGALLMVAIVGIVLVLIVAVLSRPTNEVAPLDRAKIPQVDIERKPVEEKTADEILEEVLGEEQ